MDRHERFVAAWKLPAVVTIRPLLAAENLCSANLEQCWQEPDTGIHLIPISASMPHSDRRRRL